MDGSNINCFITWEKHPRSTLMLQPINFLQILQIQAGCQRVTTGQNLFSKQNPLHTFLPKFAFYNLTHSISVKKLILFILLLTSGISLLAQDSTSTISKKPTKTDKRERINAMMRQEEEGNLSYIKQNGFGIQLRTNGYGIFFEIGRRRTQRFTTTYSIELTEIKHPKEEKSGGGFFSNPFIYGKINNFYQAKLGFGQQYIFGQKGNKNGVAVIGIAQAGLSFGMLKPYYINTNTTGTDQTIRFISKDSTAFLTYNNQNSSAGFTKGWSELKLKPGVYMKAALRFDFGRFNESVQAIEIGASLDAYADRIPIMAPVTKDTDAAGPRRFYFQGHVAFVFGRRK